MSCHDDVVTRYALPALACAVHVVCNPGVDGEVCSRNPRNVLCICVRQQRTTLNGVAVI